MLPVTKLLLTNKRTRPFLRDPQEYSIRQIKGIVAHWTANTDKGAHAKANVNYFNTTDRYASAHYVLDDHSIYQCIPDSEVAYHVGASIYKADGNRIRTGSLTPNYFLIGFEMCVNSDGIWSKTYLNAVSLAAHLLKKYQFTVYDLYRHFDITGKDCPKMMLEESKWTAFRNDIQLAMAKLEVSPTASGRVNTGELNVRKGPGTSHSVVVKLKMGDPVDLFEETDGWVRIGAGRWVNKKFVDVTYTTLLGRVDAVTGANVRKGPGTDNVVVDVLPNGAFLNLTGEEGNWYRLGTERWVHNSLVKIIPTLKGTVSGTAHLNVRFGPGTDYKIVRRLNEGDTVRIINEQDEWLQIGYNEWVFGQFIKKG